MKNYLKISFVFICVLIYFSLNFISAANLLDDTLNGGKNFFQLGQSGNNSIGFGENVTSYINSDIVPLVREIGKFVILICTIFLGIKYIFSSSEEKANFKETLPSLAVAIVFVYLTDLVLQIFTNNGNGLLDIIVGKTTFEGVKNEIWGVIVPIVNVAALSGVIFAGVKYMFASSDKKADIKKQLAPLVIGIILVYSSVNVINVFINVSNDILTSNVIYDEEINVIENMEKDNVRNI